MRIIVSLLLFFSLQISISQNTILDSIPAVKKTTHVYKTIKQDTLKLDFYHTDNDNNINKPLLIYVHGGGFSGGSRNDDYITNFANKIVQEGFSVASISYRLTMKRKGFGCDVKSKYKIKAFDSASKDISYAVNFILKNQNQFNINPDKIVISGSSAGAEAVLNLAYVYDKNILPRKFKFAGVIGLAGAITSLDRINAETAIPTQLFHGSNDNLVSYYIAAHHYCKKNTKGDLMLYGSRAIADRLKGLGKSYYLYSIIGGGHEWNSMPMHKNLEEILDFLKNDVLKGGIRQTERTVGL